MSSVGDISFEFDFGLDECIQAMYQGSYHPEILWLVRHVLHRGDIVVDVGANIGYLSAVFLDLVGRTGHVHSFEPSSRYLPRLRRLDELNPGHQLHVVGLAAGNTTGSARLWTSDIGNIGWNTMVTEYMPHEDVGGVEDVGVVRLDDYLLEREIVPDLIKVDVEGYELEVLDGLRGHLDRTGTPPWIICELAPNAWARSGRDPTWLATWLATTGYTLRSPIDLGPLPMPTSLSDAVMTHPSSTLSSRPWARRRLPRCGA